MFKVNQSKVKTYLRCRQAYHFKYVEGLRSKRTSRPLAFGTLMHEMIEDYVSGKDPLLRLKKIDPKRLSMFQSERDKYGDILSAARDIMTEYMIHYEDDGINYIKYKGSFAEHLFEMQLTKKIIFKGKIDTLCETGNGLRWLVEHKTFNQMPSEDQRWRNIQSAVYLHASDHLKIKPLDGIMWDYIWSKEPSKPQELKDGSTSLKKLNTLPTTVINTLKERGQHKKPQYRNLIKAAEANVSKYFKRIHTTRKSKVMKKVIDDFVETAEEMAVMHGKSKVKTIDRHCDWCEFEGLCRADLQGHDVEFLKKKDFYYEEDEFDHYKSKAESAD